MTNTAAAAPTPPEPDLVAPSALGIMRGFPPPPDKRIGPANQLQPVFMRWTMMNASAMACTARVRRGASRPDVLVQGPPLALDEVGVDDGAGGTLRGHALYARLGMNGIVVLHRGRLVAETYLGDMRPEIPHMVFSCTKSLVGTLVAMHAHHGLLSMAQRAGHYLPELADSALGSATLEQLLDMRANFRFGSMPHAGGTLQLSYLRAAGLLPRPADDDGPPHIQALLLSAEAAGTHGQGPFRYDNGSTETLAWVLQRATGLSLAELISRHFWAPLGMEQDAEMTLDPIKTQAAAAGFVACLRDLARWGEMMRREGEGGGRQLVPPAVVAAIRAGGDRDAFATSAAAARRVGGSYRYQWWVNHDEFDSFEAKGQFGQRIWVAPGGETVIVQVSTDPDPSNSRDPLRLCFYHAITRAMR